MPINPEPIRLHRNPIGQWNFAWPRMVRTAHGADAELNVLTAGVPVDEAQNIVLRMSSGQMRALALKMLEVADDVASAHEDDWAGSR